MVVLNSLNTVLNIFYTVEKLSQLNPSKLVCPNNDIVFQCENQESTVSRWLIRSVEGFVYSFNFHRGINNVGESRGATFYRAQVVFSNSSLLISLVTIINGTSYNGTYISCNDEHITLSLEEIGELVITLKHTNVQINFIYF